MSRFIRRSSILPAPTDFSRRRIYGKRKPTFLRRQSRPAEGKRRGARARSAAPAEVMLVVTRVRRFRSGGSGGGWLRVATSATAVRHSVVDPGRDEEARWIQPRRRIAATASAPRPRSRRSRRITRTHISGHAPRIRATHANTRGGLARTARTFLGPSARSRGTATPCCMAHGMATAPPRLLRSRGDEESARSRNRNAERSARARGRASERASVAPGARSPRRRGASTGIPVPNLGPIPTVPITH